MASGDNLQLKVQIASGSKEMKNISIVISDPFPEEDDLVLSVAEWRRTQTVFCSPAWKGRPLARHYCERLSTRHELKDKLLALLTDKDQVVVAYVLLTLDLMLSQMPLTLPEELLGRRDQITTMTGSFANKFEIGAFARHLQKKHCAKNRDKLTSG